MNYVVLIILHVLYATWCKVLMSYYKKPCTVWNYNRVKNVLKYRNVNAERPLHNVMRVILEHICTNFKTFCASGFILSQNNHELSKRKQQHGRIRWSSSVVVSINSWIIPLWAHRNFSNLIKLLILYSTILNNLDLRLNKMFITSTFYTYTGHNQTLNIYNALFERK